MANVTRFNPLTELTRFDPFREFDEIFRVPRSVLRPMPEEPQIRMDVTEDDKGYYVKADFPGVRKKDSDAACENGILSLTLPKKPGSATALAVK